MHPPEKIAEAYEMLKAGFKKEFVAKQTGVSTSTLSLIRAGKRQVGSKVVRQMQVKRFALEADDYENIITQARQALITSGREAR